MYCAKMSSKYCIEMLTVSLFEPLESATLHFLTWEVVFLVAITSSATVSELRALDCRPELLHSFTDRVVLRANLVFFIDQGC